MLKDEKSVDRFYKHQRRFCFPFLQADKSHRELQDKARLLFMNCEELGKYCFGKVNGMTLSASCKDLLPLEERYITPSV